MSDGDQGFRWRDGERWIEFAEGALDGAPQILAERGFEPYELFSTARALQSAPPPLVGMAAGVHEVAAGPVPDASAALIDSVAADCLVALGGGRVIDAAKAVAAVRGERVAAIPTTLSGAEMTAIHRLPAGREAEAGGLVRPGLVIADPVAMTGHEEPELRASAINALAHGAEALWGPLANPLASLAGLNGVRLIATALDRPRAGRIRSELALGALLCAYAVDSAGLGAHHVLCQTLVRTCGTPHAETNAAVLPHSLKAIAEHAPAQVVAVAEALGTAPEELAARVERLAGGRRRLGELGADPSCVEQVLDEATTRLEQAGLTASSPDRASLASIVGAAW